MGRPDRLTPERHEHIVKMSLDGVYIQTACEANSTDKATYYRWLDRANDPKADKKFRGFRDAVTRARAETEARHDPHDRQESPKSSMFATGVGRGEMLLVDMIALQRSFPTFPVKIILMASSRGD